MSVQIDVFKCVSLGAYILTHAHTDHGAHLPKGFPHVVNCSPITKQLMQDSHPNVNFKPNLIQGAWSLLENNILVYCFHSGHCIGGIGVFIPSLQLLHFGDGRPSNTTVRIIYEISKVFTRGKITVVCDNYFSNLRKNLLTCENFPIKIPSLRDSKKILQKVLIDQFKLFPNAKIYLKIAHFGTLSCLPCTKFAYKWIGSSSTPSSTLCQNAFSLFPFQTKNADGFPSITVSSAWDKDLPENIDDDFDCVIVLSANWWFYHCETNLFHPKMDEKNQMRIYACAHASTQELSEDFETLCNI